MSETATPIAVIERLREALAEAAAERHAGYQGHAGEFGECDEPTCSSAHEALALAYRLESAPPTGECGCRAKVLETIDNHRMAYGHRSEETRDVLRRLAAALPAGTAEATAGKVCDPPFSPAQLAGVEPSGLYDFTARAEATAGEGEVAHRKATLRAMEEAQNAVARVLAGDAPLLMEPGNPNSAWPLAVAVKKVMVERDRIAAELAEARAEVREWHDWVQGVRSSPPASAEEPTMPTHEQFACKVCGVMVTVDNEHAHHPFARCQPDAPPAEVAEVPWTLPIKVERCVGQPDTWLLVDSVGASTFGVVLATCTKQSAAEAIAAAMNRVPR